MLSSNENQTFLNKPNPAFCSLTILCEKISFSNRMQIMLYTVRRVKVFFLYEPINSELRLAVLNL